MSAFAVLNTVLKNSQYSATDVDIATYQDVHLAVHPLHDRHLSWLLKPSEGGAGQYLSPSSTLGGL